MRRPSATLVFAATLSLLGIMGFAEGQFAPIWDGVPNDWPVRGTLVYLCASISLASGVGLLWRPTAASAARALFIYLLLWFLAIKLRLIWVSPFVEASYESCGETAVILASAWVLHVSLAGDVDRAPFSFATGAGGIRLARMLHGLALIAFGFAHFAYLDMTMALVPSWLSAHAFWAYSTGTTYVAAGMAVIFDVYGQLAATLAAVQMGMLTLLVWIPTVAAGSKDPSQWSETILSWTLASAGWVVADSYRALAGTTADYRR